MADFKLTFDKLQKGRPFPVGQNHVVTIPPLIFRARLIGFHFETDKTFLLPKAMPGVKKLKKLYDDHPGFKLLISGHTDTVGTAAHNLTLSEARAQSIASFLGDDADQWMGFYAGKGGSLAWGTREDQFMLTALSDADGNFLDEPDVDGVAGSVTQAALKRFQAFANDSRGAALKVNGVADSATRKALVVEYMAQDGTSLPAGTEVQTHGCGFSHLSELTPPNTPSAENRRAEIYFFEDAVTPPPRRPCPAGGCPEYPQWLLQAVSTVDLDVPGSDPTSTKTLEIRLIDAQDQPMANAKYRLEAGDQVFENSTDSAGFLRESVPASADTGRLVLDFWSVDLEIADLDENAIAGAKARLNNLGLFAGKEADTQLDAQTTRALQRFQLLNGLAPADGSAPSGDLDDATRARLKEKHGS